MTLLKRDALNPNKLETITPKNATEHAIDFAALGYDDNLRAYMAKVDKQTKIIGALLQTLSEKEIVSPELTVPSILTDLDIRNILEDPCITSGVAQDF